jgi:hypothetical protein
MSLGPFASAPEDPVPGGEEDSCIEIGDPGVVAALRVLDLEK